MMEQNPWPRLKTALKVVAYCFFCCLIPMICLLLFPIICGGGAGFILCNLRKSTYKVSAVLAAPLAFCIGFLLNVIVVPIGLLVLGFAVLIFLFDLVMKQRKNKDQAKVRLEALLKGRKLIPSDTY